MISKNHQKLKVGLGDMRERINQLTDYIRLFFRELPEMLVNQINLVKCPHDSMTILPRSNVKLYDHSKTTRLSARSYPNSCHILFILITSIIITTMSIKISQPALASVTSQIKFKPRYSDGGGGGDGIYSSSFHHHHQQTNQHHQYPKSSNSAEAIRSRINRQSHNETANHSVVTTLTDNGNRITSTNKLALIQSQLADLKRQLEIELRVASESENQLQLTLGSACLKSTDCQREIKNSHCNADNFTCTCLPHHVQYNSTTCLPPSLLGFDCVIDAQCQQKVANSICSNGRCNCGESFVPYRKDKCLQPSKINDYCLSDRQCQINDKHSFCKWKIPQVYGLCKCPPNYKLVDQANKNDSTTSIRCAPRLGDTCLNDEECRIATRNSVCVEAEHHHSSTMFSSKNQRRALMLGDGWSTSGASSSRCLCARGFTIAPNKLDCVQEPNSPSDSTTTHKPTNVTDTAQEIVVDINPKSILPSLTNSKHHYEMIGGTTDSVSAGFSESKQMSTTRAPQTTQELEIKVLTADDMGGGQQATFAPTTKYQVVQNNPTQAVPNVATSTSTTTSTTTTTTTTTTSTTTTPTPTTTTATSPPVTTTSTRAPLNDMGQPLAQTVDYKNQSVPSFVGHRMSSLGKPCSSTQECKMRDAHSHCIQGICECLNPTARCRANLTGCHKDTFQCRNGQCISWYFVCDQFKNCDDGSDEEECRPYECPPEAFQCVSDGTCVTRGKLCNGKRDCSDGSDELLCGGDEGAQQLNLSASTTKLDSPIAVTTVAPTLMSFTKPSIHGVLDKNVTNIDGSLTSISNSTRCNPRAFTCDNGQCLPAYVFCNAVTDCADGSDENEALCDRIIWSSKRKWPQSIASTSTGTTSRRPVTSFDDGSSIGHLSGPTVGTTGIITTNRPVKTTTTQLSVGNKKQQSIGHEDESPLVRTDRAAIERLLASLSIRTPEKRGGVSGSNNIGGGRQASSRRSRLLNEHQQQNQQQAQHRRQTLSQECPRDTFTCRNGKCRSSAILCSGVDGCGDNSDEDQCEVCQCQPPHGRH